MNVIGKIGSYIVENQHIIQVAVIIVIAILVVIFAVKAISSSRRKRDILAQINDTVSEINSNVSTLGEKSKDVIYIDNRREEPLEKQKEPLEKEEKAPKQAETEIDIKPMEPLDDEPKESKAEESAPEKIVKKYYSRDCSIDKNGKEYTKEELENQIKD